MNRQIVRLLGAVALVLVTLVSPSTQSIDGWFPKLNSRGDIISGYGRITLTRADGSVQELGSGVLPQWIDDEQIVFNSGVSSTVLNARTGERRNFQPSYNFYAAGGGTWMGHWAGVVLRRYTGATIVGEFLDGGLPAVSPGGHFGFVRPFSQDHREIVVDGTAVASGPVMDLTVTDSSVVYSLHVAPAIRDVWVKPLVGGAAARVNLEPWEQPTACDGPDGKPWILSTTINGLVFYKAGASVPAGAWTGDRFNPSCRWIAARSLFRIVSSDAAGRLFVYEVTPSTVPVEPPPPPPVPPSPPSGGLATWPRKIWFVPYWSHGRYGDTPLADHVGNTIIINGHEKDPSVLSKEVARLSQLGIPLVVEGTRPDAEIALDLTVMWWVGTGSAEVEDGRGTLKALVERALQQPEKPILAYLDRTKEPFEPGLDWPATRPAWVTDRVWPTVQAYRNAGESVAVFQKRIEATLNRVNGYGVNMGLELAFYTRNGAVPVAQIVETMPLYEKWIREYPVVVVTMFADRRPTGMIDHPILREWAKAFVAANPAERPNRFDYWTPDLIPVEERVTNKLLQTTPLKVLSREESDWILEQLRKAKECK